jgi:hypothetical protein
MKGTPDEPFSLDDDDSSPEPDNDHWVSRHLPRSWFDTRPHAWRTFWWVIGLGFLLSIPGMIVAPPPSKEKAGTGTTATQSKPTPAKPPTALEVAVFLPTMLVWCIGGILAWNAFSALGSACSSCQRTWALLPETVHHLGDKRVLETVTRRDVHRRPFSGMPIATTDRKEQIWVTHSDYRHDRQCRFCGHVFSTRSRTTTEG